MTLEGLLIAEVFAVLAVFCRVGSAIMLMPGLGETYVPLRVRLIFALAVSFILAPIIGPALPPVPSSTPALVLFLAGEITVGIFIGMVTKTMLGAMHTAGMAIATHTNFAAAMLFDATQGVQSASLGVFLTLTALVVLLATGLHLATLEAFVGSYSLFLPGAALPFDDISTYIAAMVGKSFLLGLQLAVPFIVIALVVNLGIGVLARLMPSFQVFFVFMPVQILFGLLVLVAVLPELILWHEQFYREHIEHFLEF